MGIRTFLLIKMPQLQDILQVVGSYVALAELIDVLQAVRRGKRKATDLAHSITHSIRPRPPTGLLQHFVGSKVSLPPTYFWDDFPSRGRGGMLCA